MQERPRTHARAVLAGAVLLAVAAAAGEVDYPPPAFDGQTGAPPPAQPSSLRTQVLLADLDFPRALAVLPDGTMLLAEATGRVRRVDADGNASAPLDGVPEVRSVRSNGLNDLIVSPDFATTREVYLTYLAPPEGAPGGVMTRTQQMQWRSQPEEVREAEPWGRPRVARARLSEDGTRLTDLDVLREVMGRRLVHAPDGTLFMTTTAALDTRPHARDLSSLDGKVLRVRTDGAIPADNPFADRDGARPEIYSLGHRDPDGAALHPDTGELWTIEHGPMGGDELNVIRAGGDYGWPTISYGLEYSGEPVGDGLTARDGLLQPLYFWSPSIAPAGLTFYTAGRFPAWQGNLFVGAMVQRHLVRLVLDGERVVAEERLLEDRERRVRTVVQGGDGALYLLTDSEEDPETGEAIPGELLRVTLR